MSDPVPSPEELARQARPHVDSLRAAGVEWVPAPHTAALPAGVHDATAETPAAAAPAPSLFEEQAAALGPTLEQRRVALELLAEQIATCPRCAELMATRTQTVFGQGEPGAELCFIGEAPGGDEDAQGIPFVGAAGQLLNRILAACGLKREEIYVCNVIKCRPPGNRTPRPEEAANCREYLEKQLELVAPKFICTLGLTPAKNLLGTTLSLARLRGRFHDYRGIPVLCTYHPAYLLPHRCPDPQELQKRKKLVWDDMKMLVANMGRTIPPRPSGPAEGK